MKLNLDKIKQHRKKKKIPLVEMAIYLGYKTATGYYYAESGRCNFKPNHIPVLAERLDLKIDELFFTS